jgi:hypothetical protein
MTEISQDTTICQMEESVECPRTGAQGGPSGGNYGYAASFVTSEAAVFLGWNSATFISCQS